jgi:hypothetical protein
MVVPESRALPLLARSVEVTRQQAVVANHPGVVAIAARCLASHRGSLGAIVSLAPRLARVRSASSSGSQVQVLAQLAQQVLEVFAQRVQ